MSKELVEKKLSWGSWLVDFFKPNIWKAFGAVAGYVVGVSKTMVSPRLRFGFQVVTTAAGFATGFLVGRHFDPSNAITHSVNQATNDNGDPKKENLTLKSQLKSQLEIQVELRKQLLKRHELIDGLVKLQRTLKEEHEVVVENLTRKLRKRDGKIEKLNEACAAQMEINRGLEAVNREALGNLGKKDGELLELQRDLNEQKEIVQDLTDDLKARDGEVSELKAVRNEDLVNSKRDSEALQERIKNLEATRHDDAQRLEESKNREEQHKCELVKLHGELSEQKAKVEKLTEDLSGRDAQIAELKVAYNKQEKELGSLQNQLHESKQAIETLKVQHVDESRVSQEQIGHLQDQVNEGRKAVEELHAQRVQDSDRFAENMRNLESNFERRFVEMQARLQQKLPSSNEESVKSESKPVADQVSSVTIIASNTQQPNQRRPLPALGNSRATAPSVTTIKSSVPQKTDVKQSDLRRSLPVEPSKPTVAPKSEPVKMGEVSALITKFGSPVSVPAPVQNFRRLVTPPVVAVSEPKAIVIQETKQLLPATSSQPVADTKKSSREFKTTSGRPVIPDSSSSGSRSGGDEWEDDDVKTIPEMKSQDLSRPIPTSINSVNLSSTLKMLAFGGRSIDRFENLRKDILEKLEEFICDESLNDEDGLHVLLASRAMFIRDDIRNLYFSEFRLNLLIEIVFSGENSLKKLVELVLSKTKDGVVERITNYLISNYDNEDVQNLLKTNEEYLGAAFIEYLYEKYAAENAPSSSAPSLGV